MGKGRSEQFNKVVSELNDARSRRRWGTMSAHVLKETDGQDDDQVRRAIY